VTSIGGNLNIYRSHALTSLTGLDNVTSIGGSLQIGGDEWFVGNPSLISLTGLESLTSIGGSLRIDDNAALTSLTGLDNIEAGSIDSLYIYNNISLSTCDVQSVCDYLASPNGTVEIHDNVPGCNSEQEVEEACASSINEVNALYGVKTQPNPFTTSTTLSYELNQPETVSMSIYNHLGQLIYQSQENQQQGKQQLIWNAEKFADGIYYYRLQAGEQAANGKMVKVR